MRKQSRQIAVAAAAAAVALGLGGCGTPRSGGTDTVVEVVTVTEAPKEQESETASETEKTTEKESAVQKLITSVDYTSRDGTIRITLPDNTWKVSQDADEMRVFSPGTNAMINIVHATTDAEMQTLSIRTSEDELRESLTRQYSDEDAFEILSFRADTAEDDQIKTYRYVVYYKAAARMWAYSVNYGIVAEDQAYVITGTVTDENSTMLSAVEDSVDSFTVLREGSLKGFSAAKLSSNASPSELLKSGETEVTAYEGEKTMYLAADAVNIRQEPGTEADVIGSLTQGQSVTVTGETDEWYQVRYEGMTGYVKKDFLTGTAPETQAPETQAQTTAAAETNSPEVEAQLVTLYVYDEASTLYAAGGVNVRSQPGTDASVLGSLASGTEVAVIGETADWYQVATGSGTGYISKAYLTSTQPATEAPANETSTTGTDTATTGGDSTGSDSTGTTTGTDTTGTGTSSGLTAVSGTVTSSGVDTIVLAGDDGNTYIVYIGDADVSGATDGIYEGAWVYVNLDSTQESSDGTRYATSVTG